MLSFVYGTTFCCSQNNTNHLAKTTFSFKIVFKCGYDHYSTVAFGNAETNL